MVESARCNLEKVQEKRLQDSENIGRKSEPYRVGDRVRYKLNEDVRNRKGGKIAPRYSEDYEVIEVEGSGFTYVIKPVDLASRGQVKSRHFEKLKTIQRRGRGYGSSDSPGEEEQLADERTDMEERVDATNEGTAQPMQNEVRRDGEQEVQQRRKSTRQRKLTARLEVDGKKKKYGESEMETIVETDEEDE